MTEQLIATSYILLAITAACFEIILVLGYINEDVSLPWTLALLMNIFMLLIIFMIWVIYRI
jgi:hypothetical protein